MTAARWVIKRAEPTEEMRSIGGWTIGAAYDQLPQDDVADAAAVDTYRAMLQVSPSPLDDAELVEGIARVLDVHGVMNVPDDTIGISVDWPRHEKAMLRANARAVIGYLSAAKE